jgi:uncharacterized protein (TIRG00374 family)
LNKTLSKILKTAIPLGLGVFLIWYTYSKFSSQQLEELRLHFKDANYGIVLLSVLLSILSHISRAYRWGFMLEPLGHKPKLANSFMAISVAYLMNIFIPKSGEVSRAIILDKYEDVAFEKGFGTILSERFIDLIFLLGFTALALYLKFDVLYNYIGERIPLSLLYAASIGGVVLVLALLLFFKYSNSSLSEKIKKFLLGLKEGLLSIFKMKKKTPFIFHSFVIWGLYILSFYTATQALNETSQIAFSTIIIAFVVGSFTFAFTNSGFGTYPVAIAGILILFAVPFTVGTAFGWIVWISNIVSIVLFGVLSLLLLPHFNKNT